jgi:hypothetical protein
LPLHFEPAPPSLLATAAFIIEGTSSVGRVVGVNVIPGAEESQSPYRSEVGGVAGILEYLQFICIAHAITEGKVEVGLDGDQARKEAFGAWPLDPIADPTSTRSCTPEV